MHATALRDSRCRYLQSAHPIAHPPVRKYVSLTLCENSDFEVGAVVRPRHSGKSSSTRVCRELNSQQSLQVSSRKSPPYPIRTCKSFESLLVLRCLRLKFHL